MSLDDQFTKAADDIKNMKVRPTDEELLEVYALYKQATAGDCNTSRPGMLDLKGKAKWDQWDGKKGMAKDAAKQAYIDLAKTLCAKYNK